MLGALAASCAAERLAAWRSHPRSRAQRLWTRPRRSGGPYTTSAIAQAGVVGSQQVMGRESYVFVLPVGTYIVTAGSCGSSEEVTVSAGRAVHADAVCNIP